MRWLFGVAVVCVVVAVTFPWQLQDHPHWRNIRWWPFGPGIIRAHDIAINLALYFPLGLAVSGEASGRLRVLALAGAATLSLSIELAQVWSHSRIPTLLDVLLNVAGAAIGLAVSIAIRRNR